MTPHLYNADEWVQNSADFKWLRNERFHRHSIGELNTIVRRLDYFSVPFPGDVREESGLGELASVSRITRLRNGHVAMQNYVSLVDEWHKLKFVPKGPINNISTLVQTMAWRRSGDKPLSEPMLLSLLMHIRITRPQWVKESYNFGYFNLCWLFVYLNWSIADYLRIYAGMIFKPFPQYCRARVLF